MKMCFPTKCKYNGKNFAAHTTFDVAEQDVVELKSKGGWVVEVPAEPAEVPAEPAEVPADEPAEAPVEAEPVPKKTRRKKEA